MTDGYLPPGCTDEEFEANAPHSMGCKCEECDLRRMGEEADREHITDTAKDVAAAARERGEC